MPSFDLKGGLHPAIDQLPRSVVGGLPVLTILLPVKWTYCGGPDRPRRGVSMAAFGFSSNRR